MKKIILTMGCLLGLSMSSIAAEDAVSSLLKSYQAEGASAASAEQGKQQWQQKQGDRSCVDCHGTDLTQAGKHVRTSKVIQAMAPSVNPKRLSDAKKIEKWFKRNCKWTYDRVCSAQEKANFLTFLKGQ